MDDRTLPPMPQPPPPPRASNFLTYALIGLASVGAAGFFFLLFGELFIVGVGIGGIIAAVGGLHYFLWGRSMTEQAKKEAKALEDQN